MKRRFLFTKSRSCIFIFLLFSKALFAQLCSFSFSLGNDVLECPSSQINITLNGPANASSYLWDNGSTAVNRSVFNFGTYYCKASQLGSDLVVNGNFDLGNSGFTSDYSEGTGGTWGPISDPGTFLVTNDPHNAHTNFQTFNDHSGNGNMLVVNGSGNPNQSVWCQSIVVSPNTDYNFSAWVANCVVPVPLLQFSINGTPLNNVFSPPTTVGLWTQFSAQWNSGTNANAVICIVNQNISPPGNDFALDDIFFQPICTFTDSINILSKPVPTLVNAGKDTSLCEGESISLIASQGSGTSFSWTSIPTGFISTLLNPTISPTLVTTYILTSFLDGCSTNDSVDVFVKSLPIANFAAITIDSSCSSFALQLTNLSSNATSYFWDFGDGFTSIDSTPTHSYANQGSYEIKLVAKHLNCFSQKTYSLSIVFGEGIFQLANVISPNGDDKNERFFVPNECLETASVSIFNRWGVLVKKWDGLDGFWDGKIKGATAAEGVYYYIMEGTYFNGETAYQRGTISLYR